MSVTSLCVLNICYYWRSSRTTQCQMTFMQLIIDVNNIFNTNHSSLVNTFHRALPMPNIEQCSCHDAVNNCMYNRTLTVGKHHVILRCEFHRHAYETRSCKLPTSTSVLQTRKCLIIGLQLIVRLIVY